MITTLTLAGDGQNPDQETAQDNPAAANQVAHLPSSSENNVALQVFSHPGQASRLVSLAAWTTGLALQTCHSKKKQPCAWLVAGVLQPPRKRTGASSHYNCMPGHQ